MDERVEQAIAALCAAPEMASRRLLGLWLFGSHARGEATHTSDVDLAVLCEPSLDLMDRARLMDRIGLVIGADTDVIDLGTAHPALAWEIITTGKLMVEKEEEPVERFVRAARYAAEGAERRDRMVVLAQTAPGPLREAG
jgi:predicted nucleotidyltransferase